MTIRYMSGEELQVGDGVRINFERHGKVVSIGNQQLVTGATTEDALRVLFDFQGLGLVYYDAGDIDNDEDLFFVARK